MTRAAATPSELSKVNSAMLERQKALTLPSDRSSVPFWMLVDGLTDLDVERLRQELIDVLADDRCNPDHIPGFLTFIREAVAAIDGTWVHDVLPTITHGASEGIKGRVERAVLDINRSLHVALKRWLARSGRDRLYLEQGTYHWYVRAVAGETAKIQEALAFLRGCLELALEWAGLGDNPHAVALDVVEHEWRRIMGATEGSDRPELLHAALEGQRESVGDQCTFAIELFRHLASQRPAPSADGMAEAFVGACGTLGIDPRQILHQTRQSVLTALGLSSLRGPRGATIHRQGKAISKYLLADCGYRLSGGDGEMMVRLFGFSLRTAVQGQANCRLVLETEVGTASPRQETLWSGIVEGQVQVRFDRMMKRSLGPSGVAVVRLLQDDAVELSHQALRFPDPGITLDGRPLSPGRWVLPSGDLSITAIAGQEPQVTGCDLRLNRAPSHGNPGLWILLPRSDAGQMVLRLRGASGMREWRFERMSAGCSVGLALDRGDAVHLYTDDVRGTPVVDGASTKLRLTIAGDDGIIAEGALASLLRQTSIGWRSGTTEGRIQVVASGGTLVVDGDRRHLDIPLVEVLPLSDREVRQCVFQIIGVAGSIAGRSEGDASGGGDRFEVLELPTCDIGVVARRPGSTGAVVGVRRDGTNLFRLVEDGNGDPRGRPSKDVVALRGRLCDPDIPLRTMAAIPNFGIWPQTTPWDARTLLRYLTEDTTCAVVHGVGGKDVRIRISEVETVGHPIVDERLRLEDDAEGAVGFGSLLPQDLPERPVWSRLLGRGRFRVEYDVDEGRLGSIDVDARCLPSSMIVESMDPSAMTMRIRIDGTIGAPRAIECRTVDRTGGILTNTPVPFGSECDRAGWLASVDRTPVAYLTLRIHQSTARIVIIDVDSKDEKLSIPVSMTMPDDQSGLPAPPWSVDDMRRVLDVMRMTPKPWDDRGIKASVAAAIDVAVDKQAKVFQDLLLAWLRRQPKDVARLDAKTVPPRLIEAAATMWLDLAMDLPVPPDPGSWEQALREASTPHVARLLHVFDALRRRPDIPWAGGPSVAPPCRIRNSRLAHVAGFLEEP